MTDLQEEVLSLLSEIETRIVPLLSLATTVQYIEHLINSDGPEINRYHSHPEKAYLGLTAASMTNPGDIERLAALYEAYFSSRDFRPETIEQLRALVAGLRADLAGKK